MALLGVKSMFRGRVEVGLRERKPKSNPRRVESNNKEETVKRIPVEEKVCKQYQLY